MRGTTKPTKQNAPADAPTAAARNTRATNDPTALSARPKPTPKSADAHATAASAVAASSAVAKSNPAQPPASAKNPSQLPTKPTKPHASASAAASSTPPRSNPLPALYDDAMHSVFAFCGLRDLSRFLRVDQHWSAAVGSMPPMHATVNARPPFKRICEARLARHIGELTWPADTPCTPQLLSALTAHLPNLRTLSWRFRGRAQSETVSRWDVGVADWRFPGKLRSLTLHMDEGAPFSLVQQALLAVFRSCANLVELSVQAGALAQVHINSAEQMSQLRLVHVTLLGSSSLGAVPANQTESLRSLAAVESLDFHSLVSQQTILALMDSLPGPLQWTTLPAVTPHWIVDDSIVERIIAAMPRLTALPLIACKGATHNLDWLTKLPGLRSLSFDLAVCPVQPSVLLRGLGSCVQLQSLSLTSPLSWAHADFVALLSRLPLLRSLALLTLWAHQTPSFLTAIPALARTLETLCLEYHHPCDAEDLAPLLSLKAMTDLTIRGSWRKLTPALAAAFQPHSDQLPNLLTCDVSGSRAAPTPAPAPAAVAAPPRGSMAESRLRERERVTKAKAWLKDQKRGTGS